MKFYWVNPLRTFALFAVDRGPATSHGTFLGAERRKRVISWESHPGRGRVMVGILFPLVGLEHEWIIFPNSWDDDPI